MAETTGQRKERLKSNPRQEAHQVNPHGRHPCFFLPDVYTPCIPMRTKFAVKSHFWIEQPDAKGGKRDSARGRSPAAPAGTRRTGWHKYCAGTAGAAARSTRRTRNCFIRSCG